MRTRTAVNVVVTALALVFSLASCGSHRPELRPEGPYWFDADTLAISETDYRNWLIAWETADRMVFEQGNQLADVERDFRIIFGAREEAWNINAVDEVPNSSWFTNRHHLHEMTPDQIASGVTLTGGPDTSGPWVMFRPKVGGMTVGFWIEDSKGDQYIIKFDPLTNPELATAAGAMGARYFHACGYNVPEETIVHWRPEQLHIRDGVTFTDSTGVKREFTQADLEDILRRVHHEPDGRIRSLASLALPNVKGPWKYDGTYEEDPNDWCRHEHRRELRGLYVVASLVNHYDTKDQNTLTSFVNTGDDEGYLKRYLIDFGSAFGSNGNRAKTPVVGYRNIFDLRDVIVSLLTLGLKVWPWEHADPDYEYPSIGYFESEIFEPNKFDPIVPNPAFENLTSRDGYWGAKIVMAFRDDDLQALVDAGQYSNREAADYLLKTLIERRDKIGRYWFSKVNPLDFFEVTQGDRGMRITFEDLSVKYGLDSPDESRYRYEVRYRGDRIIERTDFPDPMLTIPEEELVVMRSAYQPSGAAAAEDFLYRMDIETRRDDGGWSKPARIWLWYFADTGTFKMVGLEHID